MGRPLTQSLFLEFGYNTNYAVFTLNDEDKVYNDKTYYALKKWYLDAEDPSEYRFAKECLLGWRHWVRLIENKLFQPYLQEWRDELEVAMRSAGIQSIYDLSCSETGNFQAAKWLADKGWDKRHPGRPSKAEQERDDNIHDRILKELNEDVDRMKEYDKSVN
jgi:hypothetical protein